MNKQICTCTGTCRGANKLGDGWVCALQVEREDIRKNCEECGWPQIACCCEAITHPDNPVGVKRCGECGGDHEPSGARSDCIIHWKRRAILAENKVSIVKHFGAEGIKDLFSYIVVWEKNGMMLRSDQFGDESSAKSYAAFRRNDGSRKTELWRQYQYRDELGATITNESMIEEWPFK